MALGLADLENLIAFARKNGLKSLKYEGTEFEFSAPNILPPNLEGTPLASLLDKDAEMPGDDEMLFASTPYFDELRAQRSDATAPESPREN